MKENVAVIKLVSGETIIGTVSTKKDSEDVKIGINFPLLFVQYNGQASLQFWLPTVETVSEKGSININPNAIICIGSPTQDILSHYNDIKQQTFSNIVKPTNEEKQIILNS